MGQTLDEMFSDVVESIKQSRYGYKKGGSFHPDDVVPHSGHFKYICKVLCRAGRLRVTSHGGRWGYFYEVPDLAEAPHE